MRHLPDCYYCTLTIGPSNSDREIRFAFRTQSRLLHPDKHPEPEREEFTKRFQGLLEAYECLKDNSARRIYEIKCFLEGPRGAQWDEEHQQLLKTEEKAKEKKKRDETKKENEEEEARRRERKKAADRAAEFERMFRNQESFAEREARELREEYVREARKREAKRKETEREARRREAEREKEARRREAEREREARWREAEREREARRREADREARRREADRARRSAGRRGEWEYSDSDEDSDGDSDDYSDDDSEREPEPFRLPDDWPVRGFSRGYSSGMRWTQPEVEYMKFLRNKGYKWRTVAAKVSERFNTGRSEAACSAKYRRG